MSPAIVKLAKHTTLKLNPLPIAARIQSRSSPQLPFSSPERELTIAASLAVRGAPAARPISRVHPGPYVQDGSTITLWNHVEGRKVRTHAEGVAAIDALKRAHDALADLQVELPPFTQSIDSCEPILSDDSRTPNLDPNDRLLLRRLYESFRQELERSKLLCRPLHGDTHFGNVLMTSEGAVWMDLEAVCAGPLEWDVVALPSPYWCEFEGLDPALLDLLSNLRSTCVATWCWASFDRSSETREAAIYHMESLRSRFA